jgi:CRP-like cAMP-binding protein
MKKMINLLKETDIFDQFSQSQLELVATIGKEKSFTAGDLIIREGTDNDELYIIAEGQVHIQVNPSLVSKSNHTADSDKTIATLRRGQSFGEIALVDQGLRSASAVAGEGIVRVVEFEREALLRICQDYPQLGYRLMYNLASDLAMKMRTTGLQIREHLLYGSQQPG